MPMWTSEQLDAINKDKTNIIVSAGAGSGKTAVLSERVIRKIKDGVHVNELLLLTFTNAAAKEMKDRIRKKIKKEGFVDELNLIDSSYITTFDSFSLSILKKYHYVLNISKNISIIDNDLLKYEKELLLDKVFDEYYESNNELFNKLINDFCTKDDKEIKKYILNISSKLDLITDLDNYLDNYETNYFSDKYLDSVIDDFNKLLVNKINNIKLLLKQISYYVDNDFYEKIYNSLINLINSDNYDDIKSNLGVSLPRLVTDSNEAKDIKEKISKEKEEISKICIYENVDEIKNTLLMTKDYTKIIIDIIKRLNTKLNEFKYSNNLFEFVDVAKLSIKLLRENEDIREEIKNSFNEIMIDEYQDTNDIQEEFISLISKNNVYMVGDIKQSIYRFRNANPYIFKNKYDKYSNNDNGIKIDLNKNFRSREETLNDINILFNLIMDNDIGGASYKFGHQMVFGNNTYNNEGKTSQNNDLEIYNYDYDKSLGFTREETEIFLIAKDIKEKVENNYQIFDKDECILRDAKYSDFVILLDRSKEFNLYKNIFEYLNIPLSIYKDEDINEELILTILKNFFISITKIYDNKLDSEFKHSFISILRSSIFEYSDEKIFDLFLNNSFKEDEVFNRLKSINIESMTTKELLNYIVDEFDIITSLIKVGNISNSLNILEYLNDYISLKEELGFTPKDFTMYLIDILDKKYEIKISVKKEESNSVKIMTIHKSKGLEYGICYYGGLYKEFNTRDVNDRILFDNKYGIITPYINEGINDTIYKSLIKENNIKEEISERIRLFYVALTRAKEKMIILADLNGEDFNVKNDEGVIDNSIRLKYRSFLDIIISIQKELDKYITNKVPIGITKDYEYIKKIDLDSLIKKSDKVISVSEINKDTEVLEKKHFSKTQNKLLSKEVIENERFGTKVHKEFEEDDFSNPKSNYVKKFLELYNKDNYKNIFKEYEFIFYENNDEFHGIIDLMFEYEDYIDIIDYKLKSIDDELYVKQLLGYKKVIEEKTGKKVNTYLYSIMNNELKNIEEGE